MFSDPGSTVPKPIRWAYTLATAFVLVAAMFVLAAVYDVVRAPQNDAIEVTFEPAILLPSSADPAGTQSDPVGTVVLDETESTTGKAIVHELPEVVFALLLALVAALSYRFFRRAYRGQPFARENARDLLRLAVLVVAAWPVRALAEDLAYRFVADDTVLPATLPGHAGFGLEDVVNGSLVVAIGLWALSATFSYGADLADDAAVTI